MTGALLVTAAVQAQPSSVSGADVTIGADGSVHLPAMTVPLSSLSSEEARGDYREFSRRIGLLNDARQPTDDLAALRQRWDTLLLRPGVESLRATFAVRIRGEMMGGVQTDVIEPAEGVAERNRTRVLINLHGGGFMVGARFGGQMESIPIASLGRIKVITVDYRQSPDHHFPAASEDVASVYRALLKDYPPASIGIYGCSVGGILTAESVAWFRAHGLPRPGAVGIFGGGGLAAMPGDSYYLGDAVGGFGVSYPAHAPVSHDLVLPYFDSVGVTLLDPLVSPARDPQVLAGFPPSLLISGTRDAQLSNTVYSHAQLVKAGVDAELHVWEGAPHCWFAQPVVNPKEPETREAWDVIVKFFDAKLGH